MTIIGFSFRKINAERGKMDKGSKINVANNVTVKNVEESVIPVGSKKQKALKFTYLFSTQYTPKVGFINIEGEVLYLAPEDKVKETIKSWKKGKKVEKTMLAPVLNAVLSRCSVKGLLVSQDLNLPSPMQLPHVTIK